MEKTIHLFENSFLNLNIESEDFMVSSFPNKLVLGEPFCDGYKSSRCFYFCVHEIKDLFIALSKCILFVTFEKHENSGKIIERTRSDVYSWEGFEVIHSSTVGDQQIERKFKITKESNNTKFEITFSLQQTEIFIRVINDLVLTMLCLKQIDREVIEKLIDTKALTSFDNKSLIAEKIKKEGYTQNLFSLVNLLVYYKDLFEILIEINELKNKLLHPQFFIESIELQVQSQPPN